MKISEPISVSGFYLQNDGIWQSAYLLTDGIQVGELLHTACSEFPTSLDADLSGVECAEGVEIPLETIAAISDGPVV